MVSVKLFRYIFTISFLYTTNALFEDQVGKFDWKQSYVGGVKFSFIDIELRKVFVATYQNVVAAIDLDDGRLVWRKVLEEDGEGEIQALAQTAPGELATLSGPAAGGASLLLRLWDKESGLLLSERLQSAHRSGQSKWTIDRGQIAQLVRCSPSAKGTEPWMLIIYDLKSGVVLAEHEIISLPSDVSSKVIAEMDQGACLIISPSLYTIGFKVPLVKSEELKIYEIQLPGSTLGGIEQLGVSKVASPNLALHIFTSASKAQYLLTFPKLTGEVDTVEESLSGKKGLLTLKETSGCDQLGVREHQPVSLICIKQRGSATNSIMLDGHYNFATECPGVNGSPYIPVDAGALKLHWDKPKSNVTSSKDSIGIGKELWGLDDDRKIPFATKGTPELPKGRLVTISPDNSHIGFLYRGIDDSLRMVIVHNTDISEVKWTREEALASVVAAEMVDLPVSDEEAAIEKEFANKEGGIVGMFVRRIQSQVVQVVNFLTGLLGLRTSWAQDSGPPGLRKDQFGLNKILILVTPLKVFGVESESGQIIWSDDTPSRMGLLVFRDLDQTRAPIFIHRTSRHFHLPPIASVLYGTTAGTSAIMRFNPINGEHLSVISQVGLTVKQVVQLPEEDAEMMRGIVMVSESGQVKVWPESSTEVALRLHRSLFMFNIEPETGLIEGYTFTSVSSSQLGVVQLWNVRLGSRVVRVGLKNKVERVHSQGRVLSDRSVLYKYVNPHLIAVATHSPDPQHKNVVTIYLIDSVSGAIVFSAVHKRAVPPIFIVHSENWLVYSLVNDKSRRTELISLELYEGKTQRNSSEFSSLSSEPMEPLVERQAYIFPYNVLAMRETITEKGITNKHVLVGVSSGSVLEVPWVLLDPHRSTDGTSAREEGVIPYSPDLTLPQEAYLSYNQTLPLIRGIHTSPSGLESTSLALVYGLDLFFTRVAPSKTFDVLKDDFEYWLITTVVGGLIAAAYISKKLASRKALKQAWK